MLERSMLGEKNFVYKSVNYIKQIRNEKNFFKNYTDN